MELNGRTALITGSCGEGMGRSTALRLAREGANIILNYGTHRRGEEIHGHAEKVAEAVRELGGNAIIHPADTTDEQQVKAMVDAACSEFGSVDILVNNAGGDWNTRDYTEIPLDHWKSVLSAEIDGAFLTMKYVVPGMRKCQWGRIVHIGMSGTMGQEGTAGMAPDYCLGKAVRGWMTRAFGLQEFSSGITVNCIEPGPTAHMTFEDALKAASGDYSTWKQREGTTCHDIAEIIAFLCSEAGRLVSGSMIRLPMD
ncbi:SDR family NAD(P)-dependent oxidoreductase [Candidatus Poribacteria bacterium]